MTSTTLADSDVAALGAVVYGAQTTATPIAKPTNEHPAMTVDDGYLVQNAVRATYLADGHRLVGWKAGLTSKAKMIQMGVDKPTVGFLTEQMAVPEATAVDTTQLVHPRVEGEVAFVLKSDLPTSGCTIDDVVAATAYLLPAIEIIDSRYEAFKFDLQSVIADNSSSSRFVVGTNAQRIDVIDRTNLGLAMVKNGETMTTGSSAAVMGDPAAAVAMVATVVGSLGARLTAGMVVLSGGITEAFAVQPGDHVSARFQQLGVVDVSFA
ncbi:MAG: fumarylacetoacetate hydrolase family protein [Acidimicrobiales bacterium]